ncbi:hypothetical protein YC2023_052034 [Brassica napus]
MKRSGKCSAAILGGQECQALMWLDMLMVDVNVSVALLWDPCNRPTDAEALYVPSFQVHQRVCASDAMAVTVPVLIS